MIIQGDCLERLKELKDQSVQCCVTSPPYYGLRDYGMDKQLGLESTPDKYVHNMVGVFQEVKRVLRDDGTLWLNLGDSYAGSGNLPNGLKPKDLIGIPWRVAFALQADGWYLRSDIIWNKPNAMPESVTDRPAKAHEYIFLLTKSEKYYYDHEAIKEEAIYKNDDRASRGDSRRGTGYNAMYGKKREDKPRGSFEGKYGDLSFRAIREMRNKRSVWTVTTKPYAEAHFATYPPDLIEPCILAGCPIGGIVLDPFSGAGTTGLVAMQNDREYIGIELNPEYIEIAEKRLAFIQPAINF